MENRKTPRDLANTSARRLRKTSLAAGDGFRRQTFTMIRADARVKAREILTAYPKPAYMTEIESWRELSDGKIEFTIRRLKSAD